MPSIAAASASDGAPLVVAPAASAQVLSRCAVGQTAPFDTPQADFDPLGQPFAVRVMGVYRPYDGSGHPLAGNSVGMYAGLPYARASFGYVPAPCPLAPVPYNPLPVYFGW